MAAGVGHVAQLVQPAAGMHATRSSRLLLIVLGLALGAGSAAGQATSGSGTLRGTGLLAVQRCGHDRLRAVAAVVLSPDGTWTAALQDGGAFEGTYVSASANGRRFDLSFDAASEAGFVATMAQDAAELCHTSVEVTSATKTTFVLKLNKRRTRATLVLRYRGTGVGNGRSGWARSGLTLRGRWTAG